MVDRSETTDIYVRTHFIDQATAGVDQARASMADYVAGAAAAGAAAEAVGTRIVAASSAFDRFLNKYDALTQATNRATSVQGEFNRAMASVVRQVEASTLADTAAVESKQRLISAYDKVKAAAQSAAEKASIAASIDRDRVAVDSLYAASKSYEAQLARIDNLQKATNMSLAQGNALRDQAAAAFAKTTGTNIVEQLNQERAAIDSIYASSKAYEAQLDRISAAQEKFNITAEKADVLRSQATASFAQANAPMQGSQTAEQLASAMDKQRAAIDSVFASSKAYEAQLLRIDAAEQALIITSERANALRAQATASFGQANAPLAGVETADQAAAAAAKAAQALDAQRAAIDKVFESSKAYENELNRIDAAEQALIVTSERAAALRSQATASFAQANAPMQGMQTADQAVAAAERQRAAIDSVFRISKEYEAEIGRIDAAEQALIITDVRAAALRDEATASFAKTNAPMRASKKNLDDLTGSSGQTQFAMRQLGVQTIQTFQGFATGQPIIMTLIQQGHQVADVMISAGVGFAALRTQIVTTAAYIASFPLIAGTLTVAAVAAPFVAIGIAVEAAARRMIDLQQQLRATRADYETLAPAIMNAARAAAQSSTVSGSDARVAGQIIGGAPNFAGTQQQLTDLIKLAGDLERVFNISLKAAAEQLAQALQDPARAAQDLAQKHFPGMTVAIARTVELMQLQGNVVGAQKMVMDAYSRSIKNAADAGTDLQHAWDKLGQNISKLGTWVKDLASGAISAVQSIGQWISDHSGGGNYTKTFGPGASPMLDSTYPVKVNPVTGAAGLMGIMPATAALTPNLNALDPMGNIRMGILDFQRKLVAAATETTDTTEQINIALKNYGGYIKKDPSAYIASVRGQNTSWLDPDISKRIGQYAQGYGITDPAIIEILRQLALKESTGSQYATVSTNAEADKARALQQRFWGPNGQPPPFASVGMPPGQFGPGFTSAAQGDVNILQGQKDAANTAYNTQAVQAQREVLQSTIEGWKNLRDVVGENSVEGQKYTVLIGKVSGELINARTPTEAYSKTLADQANMSGTEAGAAAALVTVYHALDEATISQYGRTATAAEKDAARSVVLRGLSADLALSTKETGIQTQAVEGSIPILGQGTKAQDDYNAKVKAQTEALKYGERGTAAYDLAVGVLTASNIAAADAERKKADTTSLYTGTEAGRRIALQNTISEFEKMRDAIGPDTEQGKLYADMIGHMRGELVNIRTPIEENTKLHVDQARVSGYEAGAAKTLADAYHALDEASIAQTGHAATMAEKEAARSIILQGLSKDLQVFIDAQSRQITQNQALIPLLEQGGLALQAYNAQLAAEPEALKAGERGSDAYKAALARLKQANIDVANSERDKAAATDIHGFNDQLDLIQKEASLVSATVEQRTRELAALRERQKLLLSGKDLATDESKKAMEAAGDAAVAQANLAHMQSSVSALEGAFTSGFNTIGNAMAQTFVQGGAAAVKWGNVMQAVLQQVIQKILELAVLNPVLNSLFPSTTPLPTLSAAYQGLTNPVQGASGGSSFGGLSSLLSYGGTASSLSGSLGGPTIGSSLGLTGPNGVLSGAGSTIGGFLATPTGLGATAAGGIAPEGAYTAAQVAASGTSGATIGQLAGGVGAGFAAGSLAGGLVQGSLNKTGPGPEVGAAVGAIAGTIIGSFIGMPVLGGIIGGTIGGAGGGLIGPHVASSYSSFGLDTSGGQFSIGARAYQKDENAGAEVTQLQQQVTALNALMVANGLSVNTGHIQIGDNTPGGYQDPSKYADLDAAIAAGVYKFTSSNPILNDKLATHQFASAQDLQTWLTNFTATQTSAQNYMTGTIDLTKKLSNVYGGLNATLDEIAKQFSDAKTAGDALINSGFLSTQQISDMTDAETRLASARDDAIKAANDSANLAIQQQDQGLLSRFYNAQATVGGPGAISTQNAALYAFDIQAANQRTSLTASLVATFGTAFKQTADYAAEMGKLETTLGEERLAVVAQYNAQVAAADKQAKDTAAQAAGSVITSLTAYAAGLSGGAQSPLSPRAKLDIAQSQFNAVSGAALAGNSDSLSQVQSYSGSLLTAAQAFYGSSAGYNAIFNQVVGVLDKLSTQSADTLTASFLAAETRTQTATLVTELQALRAEVVALKTEIVQNAAAPARVAA